MRHNTVTFSLRKVKNNLLYETGVFGFIMIKYLGHFGNGREILAPIGKGDR
jgi:hypothetical protein